MEPIWRKSYAAGVAHEIDLDPQESVVDIFDEAVATFGDRVAFDNAGATLTFREFGEQATALAAYMQTELGIAKGDRVAVMLPNCIAFPVALYAIIKCGAIQVNVNPMYTPRELQHQLNDAGAETIVVFTGSTPTLAAVIKNTPIKTVITATLSDLGPDVPSPLAADGLGDTVSFTDALAAGQNLSFEPVDLTGADTLFLQYTGGTTGLSKGAVLSHSNLVANTAQFRAFCWATLEPGTDVVITVLPLYHIFALMVNLISFVREGGTNHLVTNPRDLDGLIDLMDRVKPTVFTGVNTLFAGLVAHPRLAEIDMSNLKINVGGGAAVHEITSIKWKEATGAHICEGYGLSETSPILATNPMGPKAFSGCVGLPYPSTDIAILDDDENEVPVGEAGEICAKGPQVMSGYWGREDANDTAFSKDGYFKTGDIGLIREDGYLKIVDRKKDMVIVSGFNVFPNEVEATVAEVDGVVECACIGVPDAKTGEALRVFVVAQPDAGVTPEGLQDYCHANLAAYKVPRQFRFVDELPKSTVGKILRRELRDVS